MKHFALLALSIGLACTPAPLFAQRLQQRERSFEQAAPRVGDTLPDVLIYTPEGTPLHTSDLKGHFTVVTFGCLT